MGTPRGLGPDCIAGGLLMCVVGCAKAAAFSADGGGQLDANALASPDSQTALPSGGAGEGGACVNLECKQLACRGQSTTTVTGAVYDPAGRNPLSDVVVYVPNAPLLPIPSGPSCDTCDSLFSGSPLVVTTTQPDGTFVLTNVPASAPGEGDDIPLVVQVGKWRRQYTIHAAACALTQIPGGTLRLPSSHTEPGASIPQIAISTGGADTLECLLVRIGLDASEYTPGAGGSGHIHIFQGAGEGLPGGVTAAPTTAPPAPQSQLALWDSVEDLDRYDLLLLSCEGQETSNMNQAALYDYTAKGGRVFASHYHYAWFNTGPFGSDNLADWTIDGDSPNSILEDISATIVTALPDGEPFAKGVALKNWLAATDALSSGELQITQARNDAIVTSENMPSQAWLTADTNSGDPGATEYFSFNTEVGAARQCGRVVFSDIHVGAASGDYAGTITTVPRGCSTGELSPQEKALEFMLFDLSSCVTPDSAPPPPPPSK